MDLTCKNPKFDRLSKDTFVFWKPNLAFLILNLSFVKFVFWNLSFGKVVVCLWKFLQFVFWNLSFSNLSFEICLLEIFKICLCGNLSFWNLSFEICLLKICEFVFWKFEICLLKFAFWNLSYNKISKKDKFAFWKGKRTKFQKANVVLKRLNFKKANFRG